MPLTLPVLGLPPVPFFPGHPAFGILCRQTCQRLAEDGVVNGQINCTLGEFLDIFFNSIQCCRALYN